MDNFSIALNNALFDNEGSNFGNPSHLNFYRLDSVIYVSASVTVLIKKKYQYPWGGTKDEAIPVSREKVTLHNDPLFSKKHALDSIRNVVRADSFRYDANRAIFIGYDNKKMKENKKDTLININQPKEKQISPIVTTSYDTDTDSPFDTSMLKALAGIFLLALLGAWLSAKFYTLHLQKI